MKNIFKLLALSFIVTMSAIIVSCDKADVNRPIQVYKVRYVVKSNLASKSNFFITYMNPKYTNHVSEYFDTINQWSYEFNGETFDRLYLEAMTVRDSSFFSISIYVNDSLKATLVDTCPTPFVCDTNRVAVSYSLQ